MTDDRYKELMIQVGMPSSHSLLGALKQVANEVTHEYKDKKGMIVGVAIRTNGVIIKLPKPARHSDCFEYAERLGIDCVKAGLGIKGKDQGFYTETGHYLDRKQAFDYAKGIGIKLMDNPAGALCSENLW